jgi:hypothetical protein
MTWQGWFQIALYVAVLTALTPLLGGYMARVYMGRRVALERVLGPVERGFYRAPPTRSSRGSPSRAVPCPTSSRRSWRRSPAAAAPRWWSPTADGRLRPLRGPEVRWVRPSKGAVLQLVQHRRPVGRLIVTFRQGQWIPPGIRVALATVANALATTTGPAVGHEE